MAITWTKEWEGSDDGTILKAIDLKNIQDDLADVLTVGDQLSIPGQVQGDILYFNGTDWTRLAAGTSGQSLLTQGAGSNPIFGDVTAVGLSIAGQAEGDILYFDGSNWVALSPGTSGEVLTSNGAGVAPSFEAVSNGTSNVVYAWSGYDLVGGAGISGLYTGTDQTPLWSTATENLFYKLGISNSIAYIPIIVWKWTKVVGINTLTVNTRAWCEPSALTDVYLRLNVDNGTVTAESATILAVASPTWITPWTCDVSGLSDGTTYDIKLETHSTDNSGSAGVYVSALTVEGG